MGWAISPFVVVVLASGLIALAVGVAAVRKRPDPMAWPLALMMFAVAAWAIPHAIALGSSTVGAVAFWHRVRYPGTVFAPVLYLVVALEYAGYERVLSRRVYAGLSVVPVITIVAVWTNPYHGVFWRSLSIARIGGASVLDPTFGPWYWVNLGYLYLVTVVGLLTLAGVVVRSSRLYRKQAGLMFVGGAVPLAANGVANFAGGEGATIDFTTTALAVTGITFALALFYLDLLEIRPVARDQLVESLDDGVLIVGPNGRIRDFNPVAARVLGDIAIQQPADDVLPTHVAPDGGELVVEIDGQERVFRTRSTPLTDEHDGDIGRIVYLNDVTELVEREQRISVLNRVLRHNVRNELNIASGQLKTVADTPSADDREPVRTAIEAIDRVIELAEKARYVEQTLRDGEWEVVSAASTAERVVSDARETYPGANIEYASSMDRAPVRVVDGDLFEIALGELVENGVVHNDHGSPRVAVRIESSGNRTLVRVVDDGPGIPEAEREILDERAETPLEHGDGIGLWLVKWTTSLSSGDISFEENDPRGSIVTLSLPTATREETAGVQPE